MRVIELAMLLATAALMASGVIVSAAILIG
jgi:hypothetical protein